MDRARPFGLVLVPCTCLWWLVVAAHPTGSVRAHATPVGETLDVWRLLAGSDEIWRGEILATAPGAQETVEVAEGPIPVQWVNVRMRVDRVIRGAASVGVAEFQFAEPPDPFAALPFDFVRPGGYVIVFLARDNDRLAFTSPYAGKMAVPPTGAEAPLEASSAGEALTQELVRALGSTQPREVLEALRQLARSSSSSTLHELQKLTTSNDEAVRARALETLTAMEQTSSFAAPVQELTTSPDGDVRGEAFATLLAMGQDSCVPACLEFLRAEPTDAGMEYGQRMAADALADLSETQLKAIVDAYTQENGRDFAAALTPLLSHKTRVVRVAATRIFRKIATRALLPTLVKLLDSPDREVQYNIMIALYHGAERWCNTLVKGLVPSWEEFLQDPLRYVTQWKLWWEEGAKVEPPRDEHGNPIPIGRID